MILALVAIKAGGVMTEKFILTYNHCDQEWTEQWDCTCNDKCPVCNQEIEPREIISKEEQCKRLHTECPEDYINWHKWAGEMEKTHYAVRCPICGEFAIWKKR